jgi:hypothetical protein
VMGEVIRDIVTRTLMEAMKRTPTVRMLGTGDINSKGR